MARSPADGLSDPQRAAFEALRARFRAGLSARLAEIEGAAASERVSPLHRLAGAAGLYGFDALAEVARQAERLAVDGPAEAFDAALDRVRAELRATIR